MDWRKINWDKIDPADFDQNEADYIDAAMKRDAYHRRQEARAEEMKKKENKPAVLPAPQQGGVRFDPNRTDGRKY